MDATIRTKAQSSATIKHYTRHHTLIVMVEKRQKTVYAILCCMVVSMGVTSIIRLGVA